MLCLPDYLPTVCTLLQQSAQARPVQLRRELPSQGRGCDYVGIVNKVISGQAADQKTNCVSMEKDWAGVEGVSGHAPRHSKAQNKQGESCWPGVGIKAREMQRNGPH